MSFIRGTGLVSENKRVFIHTLGLDSPEALVAAHPNFVPYQEFYFLLSGKFFAPKKINPIYLQFQGDNNAIVPSHQQMCSLEVFF